MRADAPDRQRGSAGTRRVRSARSRDRFSAIVILIVTIASTALSIYDLHLLVSLLAS